MAMLLVYVVYRVVVYLFNYHDYSDLTFLNIVIFGNIIRWGLAPVSQFFYRPFKARFLLILRSSWLFLFALIYLSLIIHDSALVKSDYNFSVPESKEKIDSLKSEASELRAKLGKETDRKSRIKIINEVNDISMRIGTIEYNIENWNKGKMDSIRNFASVSYFPFIKDIWNRTIFSILTFLFMLPFAFYLSFYKQEEVNENIIDGIVSFVFLRFIAFNFKEKVAPSPTYNSNIIIGPDRNAYLTENNLNYHTQIIGGSGAGKTNLLKVLIEDRVAKGHSVIFFDLKADIELMDWLTGLSTHYNRREDLVVVNMSDPSQSHAYNPIFKGSETEISSQLMNSFTWSEPFYKNVSEGALLVTLKAYCFMRDNYRFGFHLGDLYSFFTNTEYRMEFLSDVANANYPSSNWNDLKKINEDLSTNKVDNYQSLIIQFTKIMNSTAADIVTDRFYTEGSFDFQGAIESGAISYLFMNSLKLKETATVMGRIMLQDLMKTVGSIYDDREASKHPTTLIIDEFASFAMPDFGEFIEKARGAGIGIVIAYQSRKSLDHIGQSLSIKINENTATKIVFHTQDSDDVEWFSSLIGTKKVIAETHQEEDRLLGSAKTGMKSVREVEEFIIHPNKIKNLKKGQALLYCSKVDQHFGIINIMKAKEYSEKYEMKVHYTEDQNVNQKEEVNDSAPSVTHEDDHLKNTYSDLI